MLFTFLRCYAETNKFYIDHFPLHRFPIILGMSQRWLDDEKRRELKKALRPFFLLVGLRDRRCWNSRFLKKEKNWNCCFFIDFFKSPPPANPVHESTTFIALPFSWKVTVLIRKLLFKYMV
jgi:hypothetical protein